jgi:hypothetical protein
MPLWQEHLSMSGNPALEEENIMRGMLTIWLFVIATVAAVVAGPVQAEESAARAPRIERSALPSGVSSTWWAEILGSLSKAASPPHGTPTDSIPSRADWTAESDQGASHFGNSVGTAGDVNGDGFDDVIVGAPFYDDGQTDEGRAFVYHGSASGLSLTPAWTAESDQESSLFGISVGTAGDVNGDGFEDVIVGADGYDNGQSDEGRAFSWYGQHR